MHTKNVLNNIYYQAKTGTRFTSAGIHYFLKIWTRNIGNDRIADNKYYKPLTDINPNFLFPFFWCIIHFIPRWVCFVKRAFYQCMVNQYTFILVNIVENICVRIFMGNNSSRNGYKIKWYKLCLCNSEIGIYSANT